MKRIDEEKLDKISDVQRSIVMSLSQLEKLQEELTPQEKVIFGGWAFISTNSWTNEDVVLLGGDAYTILNSMRKTIETVARRLADKEMKNSMGDILKRSKNKILN